VSRSGGHDAPVAASAPALPSQPAPPIAPVAEAPSRIALTSEPAGAEVWIGHEATPRGRTPLTIDVPAGSSARAVVKSEGHEPVTLVLDAKDGKRHVVLPTAAAPPPAAVPSPARPAAAPPVRKHHAKGGGFKAIED
ncbi:MAG TPA: PEGA domain-containing protein, partial [Polyangia bacterium]|nr:PEGA domain-containing protein [Polyangia bacterium]